MPHRYAWKIVWPMIILGTALLAVGVFAAWNVRQQQQLSSDLIASEVHGMLTVEMLHMHMREIRYQVNLYLRTFDPVHLRNVASIHAEADKLLPAAQQAARTPEEKELIQEVIAGYNDFFSAFVKLVNPREKPPQATGDIPISLDAADKANIEQLSQLSDVLMTEQVLNPLRECIEVNNEVLTLTNRASEDAARHLTIGFLLLGLCGGAAGILLGVVFGRTLGRSIVQLNVSVRGVADRLSDVRGPVLLTHSGDLTGLGLGIKQLEADIGQVVERLQQRERELMRSEQLAHVGQLAAGLAHEFRNPLMPMKMLVQAAMARGDDAGLRGKSLQVLNEEISRLENSIQAFLDFARPPKPEKKPEDICEIVRQTAYLARGRCEQQDVRVNLNLPAGGVTTCVDRNQLRQLLLNLILNSLDAMPDGGELTVEVRKLLEQPTFTPQRDTPTLSANTMSEHDAMRVVSTSSLKRRQDWVSISIADTGPGIPADILDRIFEPFITSKETGTGLGLSTCQRIAEMHSGKIRAVNRTAGGSEFTLFLPIDP